MASQSLSDRLEALSDTYQNTIILIQRLRELPSTPGTSSDTEPDVRVELSTEIHQSLKEHENELGSLQHEAEDEVDSLGLSASFLSGGGRRKNGDQISEKEEIRIAIVDLGRQLKA